MGSASSGVNQHSFAKASGVKRVQERPKLGQSDAQLLLCSNVTLFLLPTTPLHSQVGHKYLLSGSWIHQGSSEIFSKSAAYQEKASLSPPRTAGSLVAHLSTGLRGKQALRWGLMKGDTKAPPKKLSLGLTRCKPHF